MCLNHSKTTPSLKSVEILSSSKRAPGAKIVGDHCFEGIHYCLFFKLILL